MGLGKADTPKTCWFAEDAITLAAVSGSPVFPPLRLHEKKISIGFLQYRRTFQAILFILYILYTVTRSACLMTLLAGLIDCLVEVGTKKNSTEFSTTRIA